MGALRCAQELSEHDDAMFLTLTYDERHVPTDHSLDKPEFQKFMKRLRKHAHPQKVFVVFGHVHFVAAFVNTAV